MMGSIPIPNTRFYLTSFDGKKCLVTEYYRTAPFNPDKEPYDLYKAFAEAFRENEREKQEFPEKLEEAAKKASGVTLVLNGNTIFASDDTSYWLQESKIIGGNGHVYGHAQTIQDALCLVLAKYGGLKGNSTKQVKQAKKVSQW